MEDIKILKENVKEAFKDGDNFDFSDTHLNEIIDSINYLIGKPDLYEKLEEFKNKNYPDFQLACYFLPDEYLEYYYNHEYGDYLTESTNIKILKAKEFPLAKSLQEMKPFQENLFLEVVEKHMHNSNVPTVSKQY